MDTPELRDRLVAILAADAAGYSRLMSVDDRATVAALDAARAVFREEIAAHGGRVVDTAGDSVLAVFETATGAVAAALTVQQRLANAAVNVPDDRRMRFRIGVHMGDVIEKVDGTIYGDGVNIAARLEGLAEPGGIAVSQAVQSMVARRVDAEFEDIGEQRVKNIGQPIRAFRLRAGLTQGTERPNSARLPSFRQARVRVFLAVTTLVVVSVAGSMAWWKPWQSMGALGGRTGSGEAVASKAIAVLAFANLGDDKADEVFVDGVSEELLDVLSRLPELRVAARTSAFQFKGKPTSAQEIGRQLGVDYLVEGSVRKIADRVRVSAQLVKTSDGFRLWSETFEREAKDVLAVQEEIAIRIAKALALKIGEAQLAGGGTDDVEALQLYLEGNQLLNMGELADAVRAEQLFERALERDPKFARAKAGLAAAWLAHGLLERSPEFTAGDTPWQERIIAKAYEALAIDPHLADAYATIGLVQMVAWQIPASERSFRQALALNPNHGEARNWLAWHLASQGRMDDFLRESKLAVERDPLTVDRLSSHALNLMAVDRSDEALVYAERALRLEPDEPSLQGIKAWALARSGRKAEAEAMVDRLVRNDQLVDGAVLNAMSLLGDQGHLEEFLDRLPPDRPRRRMHPLLMLGRVDEALELLPKDKSQVRFANLWWFILSPDWDAARRDPRFRTMLERFNVAEGHDRAQVWRTANVVRRQAKS